MSHGESPRILLRPRSGYILAEELACCLTPPSNYLNRYYLLFSEFLWHSPEINFTACTQATVLHNEFENYDYKMIAIFYKDQWVNFGQMQCQMIRKIISPDTMAHWPMKMVHFFTTTTARAIWITLCWILLILVWKLWNISLYFHIKRF